MTKTTQPVLLRAEITEAEYRRVRKAAINRGIPTKALVAEWVRAGLADKKVAA